jgi:hypothetical protein
MTEISDVSGRALRPIATEKKSCCKWTVDRMVNQRSLLCEAEGLSSYRSEGGSQIEGWIEETW